MMPGGAAKCVSNSFKGHLGVTAHTLHNITATKSLPVNQGKQVKRVKLTAL